MPVERMTAPKAQALLRQCLEEGSVIPSKHFREELAKESFTYIEVEHVLRHGNIYAPPEQHIRTGEWAYRIEGRIEDGQDIAVVFCFKKIDQAFLITVFSIKRR